MVHRSLDVLFQFWRRLALAVVAVPLLLAGGATVTNQSTVVSAHVWTDRPTALAPLIAGDATATARDPAGVEAELMQELFATDSFLDQVLTDTRPGYGRLPRSERPSLRQDLRKRLSVVAEGSNLVTVSYSANDAQVGVKVLNVVLADYQKASAAVVAGLAAASQAAVDAELRSAEQDLRRSSDALATYVNSRGGDPVSLAADPTFLSLSTAVKVAADRYQQAQQASAQNQLLETAAPEVRAALFHITDPPAPDSQVLSTKSPALRLGLIGLVATLVGAALFVYVLARRDPRLRVGPAAAAALGVRYLGSIRMAPEAAP